MREIKFRAWYKGNPYIHATTYEVEQYNKPQMVYNVHKLYDGGLRESDDPNGILIGYSSFGSVLDDEDFIVEQFTGCLDKNGVEIYEGDILSVELFRAEIEDCTDLSFKKSKEKVNVKFKVVQYKTVFVLEYIENPETYEPLMSLCNERGVVIGNIHENK